MACCDGKADSEISRRLGQATGLFRNLQQVWSHASISTGRKLRIFEACVITKLIYSLDSLWMLKADRARLDAFQCRCLRRILRIQPSYFSRIANERVFEWARTARLSDRLLERQVSLYRTIAEQPGTILNRLMFDDCGHPKTWNSKPKRGRPRQRWTKEVHRAMSNDMSRRS